MPLKIPLLTVWRAKCSDAIPYMTSIKRFHSPEAQNNPEKLSRRRESLYPHFVMNANYQGNRSAPQTGCYLFSYHLEIIVKFSLTGHWEGWSAGSEFGLASFEWVKPPIKVSIFWAVFTSPHRTHTQLVLSEDANVWGAADKPVVQCRLPTDFATSQGMPPLP